MTDIDTIHYVNDLRDKIRRGEDIPPEELAEAIQRLRSNRKSAASTKKKSGAKPSSLPDNLADLLLKNIDIPNGTAKSD